MTIFSINSGSFGDVTVTGIVSASVIKGDGSQITSVSYDNIASKPTLISSSTQVTALLPAGTFSSSAQVGLNSISGSTFSNNSFTFPQNLTVAGNLTAQTFQTEYITSSVIYESGSTKFGDSADDTHEFTGSLELQGQFYQNGILVTLTSQDYGLITGTVDNFADYGSIV